MRSSYRLRVRRTSGLPEQGSGKPLGGARVEHKIYARVVLMNTTTSIKLDAETKLLLKKLSKERGETQSEVIRNGILALAEGTEPKEETFYERYRHIIGRYASRDQSELSRDTGRKFAEEMAKKHRRSTR